MFKKTGMNLQEVAKEKQRRVIQLKSTIDEDCCICLQSMLNRKVVIQRCGHPMHLSCERKIMKFRGHNYNHCPLCRCQLFDTDDLPEKIVDVYAGIIDYWNILLRVTQAIDITSEFD